MRGVSVKPLYGYSEYWILNFAYIIHGRSIAHWVGHADKGCDEEGRTCSFDAMF